MHIFYSSPCLILFLYTAELSARKHHQMPAVVWSNGDRKRSERESESDKKAGKKKKNQILNMLKIYLRVYLNKKSNI